MSDWMPASDCGVANTDARLAALEQLSALDQELELAYGFTGNPLIRARAEVTHWMDLPEREENG